MIHEFNREREYSYDEIVGIKDVALLLINQQTSQAVIDKILNLTGAAAAAFSIYVTAPISVSVATLVAGFLHSSIAGIPSSRDLAIQGYIQLSNVEYQMRINGFDKVLLETSILRVYGNNTQIDVIQAASAKRYCKGSICTN